MIGFRLAGICLVLLITNKQLRICSATEEDASHTLRGWQSSVNCLETPSHDDCQKLIVSNEESAVTPPPRMERKLLDPVTGAIIGVAAEFVIGYLEGLIYSTEEEFTTSLNASINGTTMEKFRYVLEGGKINFNADKVFSDKVLDKDGNVIWEFEVEMDFDPDGREEITLNKGWWVRHRWEPHPKPHGVEVAGREMKGPQLFVHTPDKRKQKYEPKNCSDHANHYDCNLSATLSITGRYGFFRWGILSWKLEIEVAHKTEYIEAREDPHFHTWGTEGTWFDFHGECDLVFVHAPDFYNGLGLDIHLRTTIRYKYSYVESAALRIGDSILEVDSFGQYSLDGIDRCDLNEAGAKLAGLFPIRHSQVSEKQHIFQIVLDENESITISTFKDMVSVKMTDGTSIHLGSSVGLMGSFEGEMVSRNGTIISDPTAFGQEWQVLEHEPKLFRTIRPPQQPLEQCRLPDQSETLEKRLKGSKVSEQEAETACGHFHGERKAQCIVDVRLSDDVDLARASEI